MDLADLHELCVKAAIAFMGETDLRKHISYIAPDDLPADGPFLKSGGRIPKVTIEWVDEAETMPENV